MIHFEKSNLLSPLFTKAATHYVTKSETLCVVVVVVVVVFRNVVSRLIIFLSGKISINF